MKERGQGAAMTQAAGSICSQAAEANPNITEEEIKKKCKSKK